MSTAGTAHGAGGTERLVSRIAERMTRRPRATRRDFLGGAAVVGAAVATAPWSYLTRPASAYTSLCGTDTECNSGYTVFCCTINGGSNTCPPNSFIGGWWKADNSSYCGGAARYYIDCNSYRGQGPACHCNTTTCDHRRVNCNQFRYGQCNTQISWAQTGPVLCRMISCVPPWQRWAGTCSSSSATDNNTAGHTAPCLTPDRPAVGSLWPATVSDWLVKLSGWAYDPDAPSTSSWIEVHEDDRVLGRFRANRYYARVNEVMHITGNHAFEVLTAPSPGRHTYRVYAVDTNSAVAPRLFGQTTVTVGRAPTGHLDSATVSGTSVRMRGWAFDGDIPGAALRIEVHIDGTPIARWTADVPRPDVDRVFGITGAHGFDFLVPGRTGTHRYDVLAVGQSATGQAGALRAIAAPQVTI